jgi:hypothetical protein
MFKRILIYATLGGILSLMASTGAAATPAVPKPTAMASLGSPSIEPAHWYQGGYYPYRWRGGYWHHRRWWGNRWHYW